MAAPTLQVLDDPEALARAAAETIAGLAVAAIAARGAFSAALAGGSTPRRTYEILASGGEPPYRERIDWSKAWFCQGDERFVPPDHEASNYRMTREALYSKVSLPPGNALRVRTEAGDLEAAAGDYESRIRERFRLHGGEFPRFDLVLLGLGADGHTASLFPGSPALSEAARIAVVHRPAADGPARLTLTYPVLNRAADVVFLVAGPDKAEALRELLRGDAPPERIPARGVRPSDGRLAILADRAAARLVA